MGKDSSNFSCKRKNPHQTRKLNLYFITSKEKLSIYFLPGLFLFHNNDFRGDPPWVVPHSYKWIKVRLHVSHQTWIAPLFFFLWFLAWTIQWHPADIWDGMPFIRVLCAWGLIWTGMSHQDVLHCGSAGLRQGTQGSDQTGGYRQGNVQRHKA